MAEKQESIGSHLESHGLDQEYWLPIFEKHGIRSKPALNLVQKDVHLYSKLKEEIKFEWEKKALKKLLNITKFQTVLRKVREPTKKKGDLSTEKKIPKEERVKRGGKATHCTTKEDIQQDTDSESELSHSVLPSSPVRKAEQGERPKREVARTLKPKPEWSDAKVLANASGGRALRGILLNKSVEDLLMERSILLKAPENIAFQETTQIVHITKQFSLKHQEELYKKTVEIFGHAVAVSTKVRTCQSEILVEQASEGLSNEMYSSTVQYTTVHLATYHFESGNFKLSDEAMQVLMILKDKVSSEGGSSTTVQAACEEFFQKYGSHINKGPFHFGGIYWQTCSSSGFKYREREEVSKLQGQVLLVSSGDSLSNELSINNAKEDFIGRCSANVLANTHLNINVHGGSKEVVDLSEWKTDLITHNNTWILADRGIKLIAIWDIIEMNHSELCAIKEVLKNAWQKMTGLTVEQNLLIDSYDPDKVLSHIEKLKMSETLKPETIENMLEHLTKVKSDLVCVTKNPQTWCDEYLNRSSFQKFLLSVLTPVSGQDQTLLERINSLMKKVVEPRDITLMTPNIFPEVDKLGICLYNSDSAHSLSLKIKCKDFQAFGEFLNETINEMEVQLLQPTFDSFTNHQDLKVTVAAKLTEAISSLRSQLQQSIDDIFLYALVFPFNGSDSSDTIALNPISFADFNYLKKVFQMHIEQFSAYKNEKNQYKLQAFMFHLSVTVYCDKPEAIKDESQLKLCLQNIQQDLTKVCQLESQVAHEVTQYQTNVLSLMQFKDAMKEILRGCLREQASYEDDDHSLQKVLSTVVRQDATNFFDQTINILLKNPEAHSLFKELDLCELYPKKLSMEDALRIRSDVLNMSLNKMPITSPAQLPKLTLHKIMSYDHLCRSDLIHAHKERSSTIHPMDILLSLITCSDDFLRQDLMARLAKCQLAIPFILPDPFTKKFNIPLWAIRSVVKEWKSFENDGVVERECPIITYPTPIVAFIRIGKRQRRGSSKSRIMNEVISKSHYDHFFHRDCAGGHFKLIMGEGLIDTCWYLPAAKPDDEFPVAVTFLNLHGDAREFPQLSRFLSEISSMCFVLLTEEEKKLDQRAIDILKSFSSSLGGLVLLSDTDNPPTKLEKKLSKLEIIDLPALNAHDIKMSIQNKITENLQLTSADQFNSHKDQFKTLEECAEISRKSYLNVFQVDEDSETFRKGQKHANEVMKHVYAKDFMKIKPKHTMIPLQGKDMWQTWSTMDKELHRQFFRGKSTVNDYTDKIENEKEKIREKQLVHVSSLTPVMESFLESLLNLGGISNFTTRNFFLQCLKCSLNDLSRKTISELQRKYTITRQALSKAQANVESTDLQDETVTAQVDIEEKKKELNELHIELINASFGLEHLLRELGQLYETAQNSLAANAVALQHLSRLPIAAAELLIDGYPLEVMDGDAAHVPVRWIRAVLTEVGKLLDDPRVYVMSVLGLQSTGKSTMLNTAFGLQFNVSAGRCTRGAFMQLLPVSEEIKQVTNCAYILVVDTEGLRAPELDSQQTQKHDNELATFVIGLANVTLINIYGEVPGDMDDILQTSVHAFLRMNAVKFSPSCQFVHQNAGASVNSEMGRANFTQKLNNMTADAARAENCVEQYKSFDDVIQFDDQKDVHHFPGLWKGDPPMAPVNQGYSERAQNLKRHIICILFEKSAKVDVLTSFEVRIGELWDALLTENFIFSFKNALEIAAYNSLEAHYNSCDWEFQKDMLNWEKRAENDISAAAHDDISNLVDCKRKDADSYVKRKYEQVKSKLQKFFEDSKNGDILSQWKAKFELKLESLSEELHFHAKQHCEKVGSGRLANSKFEEERKQYEALMTEMVEEVIQKTKQEQEKLKENLELGKLDHEQIQEILKKGLFQMGKLEHYKKQKMISQSQFTDLKKICRSQQGNPKKLTEEQLRCILEGTPRILSIDEIELILRTGQLKPEQLREKFDAKWIKLLRRLPPVHDASVNVEEAVEERLFNFVGNEEGQLINQLQVEKKKSLREWGTCTPFEVKETIHYVKIKGSTLVEVAECVYNFGRRIVRTVDPRKAGAQTITNEVFDIAMKHLDSKVREKVDFNKAYTTELLRELEDAIQRKAKDHAQVFALTPQYRIKVFLSVCGYAVERFEEMAEAFKERNNPRVYLERKLKEPLFTRFKNQYYQTAKEEAIASTLCAHLAEPIKTQVENSFGTLVVERMKGSLDGHCFSSKATLKAKILLDLGKAVQKREKQKHKIRASEQEFQDYIDYLRNKKGSLQHWIKKYIIQYCDARASSGGKSTTQLQALAKEEVSRMIDFIKNKVDAIKTVDANEWLKRFCEDKELVSELGVKLDTSAVELEGMQELQLDTFHEQVRDQLDKLKMKLHSQFQDIMCSESMHTWRNQPVDLIMKLCVGCTEQCPFCKEQCDLREHDKSIKHRITQHRPQCLGGYRYTSTKRMALDLCPADVAGSATFHNAETNQKSYPYNKYQDIYPDWSITPDLVAKDSSYWKWFVGKFYEEIAETFSAKAGDIPDGWKKMKWKEVKKELKELYKL